VVVHALYQLVDTRLLNRLFFTGKSAADEIFRQANAANRHGRLAG